MELEDNDGCAGVTISSVRAVSDCVLELVILLEAGGFTEVGVILDENILSVLKKALHLVETLLFGFGSVSLDLVHRSGLYRAWVNTAEMLLCELCIRVPVGVFTDVPALHDVASLALVLLSRAILLSIALRRGPWHVILVPLLNISDGRSHKGSICGRELLGNDEGDHLRDSDDEILLLLVEDLSNSLLLIAIGLAGLLVWREGKQVRRVTVFAIAPLIETLLEGEISFDGEDGLKALGVEVRGSTEPLKLASLYWKEF